MSSKSGTLAAVGDGKKPRSLRRLALKTGKITPPFEMLRFYHTYNLNVKRELSHKSSDKKMFSRFVGRALLAGDCREITEESKRCPETRKERMPVGADILLIAIDENIVEIAVYHRNEIVHDLERTIQLII